MMPNPLVGVPWEVMGGLLAGVAALITSIVTASKLVAETRAARKDSDDKAEHAQRQIDQVIHELKPNSGGSTRDAINRIEDKLNGVSDRVDNMDQSLKRHDKEFSRVNDNLASLGHRITNSEKAIHDQLDDHSERVHNLESLAINSHIYGLPKEDRE